MNINSNNLSIAKLRRMTKKENNYCMRKRRRTLGTKGEWSYLRPMPRTKRVRRMASASSRIRLSKGEGHRMVVKRGPGAKIDQMKQILKMSGSRLIAGGAPPIMTSRFNISTTRDNKRNKKIT